MNIINFGLTESTSYDILWYLNAIFYVAKKNGDFMKYFDSHSHIGLIHDDAIEQLIIVKKAKQANVEHIVSICNNIDDFFLIYNNLKLAKNVYHAVGVSPSEVENLPRDWEDKIAKGVAMDRVIAIGETGLDYYRKFGSKDEQVELFIRQLELANKYNLPAIVHNRDSGKDVYNILKDRTPERGAILHCYSEDEAYAEKVLDLNIMISFAGNLTFKFAKNLHATAKFFPLDRILIESEAPFMTPAIYKGKRNKPAYIGETLKALAEIKDMPIEEVAETVYNNSIRFFGLDN